RKVILQRRTSVTEEKIKYERRISSSSEDIKFEKKKSTSEELLEKRGSTGSGNGNSNYNSGSSSGDELVVLRKKFVVGEKEGKDKDGTPELMKVFARRSLKLRSDDDYKVTDNGKPLSSIDSDKENQSSEEKLDKVGLQQTKQSQQQQQQQQPQPELISTSLVQAVSVTPLQAPVTNGSLKNGCTGGDGVPLKNGSNENGQVPVSGEAILRKSVTSKPFGVPNRFSNATNGGQPRNATSFVEVRKTLLPSATVTVSPVNNNFVKSTTPVGQEACENQSPVSNNNTINTNRHTIASLNQLNSTNGVGGGVGAINNNASNATNTTTIIETDGGNGEINEFKGILQRRAEWEKRAKEGFK
uniref:DUF4739 domain-containing protein n=1 Tax=Anopheles maculatus TaxID=74869 RepID=A0A182SGX7_9DIPT